MRIWFAVLSTMFALNAAIAAEEQSAGKIAERLRSTLGDAELELHSLSGLPTAIRFEESKPFTIRGRAFFAADPVPEATETALEFVQRNLADAYGLDATADLVTTEGIGHPTVDWQAIVTAQQLFQGRPVYGAGATFTVNHEREVQTMRGMLIPAEQLVDTGQPEIGWGEAIESALSAYRRFEAELPEGLQSRVSTRSAMPNSVSATLVVAHRNFVDFDVRRATLVWKVDFDTVRVFVDAASGAPLDVQLTLSAAAERRLTTDLDTEENLLLFTRKFEDERVIHRDGRVTPLPPLQSADEVLSVHDAAKTTWRYFERFNLRGIHSDGVPIASLARFGRSPMGHWNRSSRHAEIGPVFGRATDLTIHEFVHGFLESRGDYSINRQTKAASEALADFLAVAIEARNEEEPDWELGEALTNWAPPRDLSNPAGSGLKETLSEFTTHCPTDTLYDCAHVNSGILSGALYRMANGDAGASPPVPGLGVQRTVDLVVETVRSYERGFPTTFLTEFSLALRDECNDRYDPLACAAVNQSLADSGL